MHQIALKSFINEEKNNVQVM